jgi:hypothetical protein
LLALALAGSVSATVRFSGVTHTQLGVNVREYPVVYGCFRPLTAAAVAVTVAVGDTPQNLHRHCPPQLCVAGL